MRRDDNEIVSSMDETPAIIVDKNWHNGWCVRREIDREREMGQSIGHSIDHRYMFALSVEQVFLSVGFLVSFTGDKCIILNRRSFRKYVPLLPKLASSILAHGTNLAGANSNYIQDLS